MAGISKRTMAWGMTYQQCLQACIASALDNADDQAADLYRNQPIPSEQEWAIYLQEVAEEPSEDLSNPYHVMGRYELRLLQRGLPTVLAEHAWQVASKLQSVARKVGLPDKFILDAFEKSSGCATPGLPRDKTRDN